MLFADLYPAPSVHVGKHGTEEAVQTAAAASVRGCVERERLLEVALILAAHFGAGASLVALRGGTGGLRAGHAIGTRAALRGAGSVL